MDRTVAAGLTLLLALLAALTVGADLGLAGWAAGLACGVTLQLAVRRALARSRHRLGPADLVTLVRATLTCGVAGIVAEELVGSGSDPLTPALVTLASCALVLDAVDGWIARRTRTSPFGARFDGEVDAFLILVLSIHVAAGFAAWVILIGAARYLFWAAGRMLPWLQGQLPWRYWRKVVAATEGVVLTVASSGVLPRAAAYAGLVVALGLLAESFGRDVWWLYRHRDAAAAEQPVRDEARAVAG